MTHRPPPAVLAAIAAAYALVRAARTSAPAARAAGSRWALAGRMAPDAETHAAMHVASRWARAGRSDG